MIEVIEKQPTIAIDAVELIVAEEAADLFAEFKPDDLIRFWGGRRSTPALELQAHFAGERIFKTMSQEGAHELDVSLLSIQALHMMRGIYGQEEKRELTAHYALGWRAQLGRKPDTVELTDSKNRVITQRLGRKATSRAITIYQYGM